MMIYNGKDWVLPSHHFPLPGHFLPRSHCQWLTLRENNENLVLIKGNTFSFHDNLRLLDNQIDWMELEIQTKQNKIKYLSDENWSDLQ